LEDARRFSVSWFGEQIFFIKFSNKFYRKLFAMEEGFYQRLPIQCVFPYIVIVRQRIKEQDQVEAGEEMKEAC
jgi:hypothetical protein